MSLMKQVSSLKVKSARAVAAKAANDGPSKKPEEAEHARGDSNDTSSVPRKRKAKAST